jgi:serpin B
VDEKGTEAAAATAVVMVKRSMVITAPLDFIADRPFIFMIEHVLSKSIVFIGTIMQPM